MKFWPFWHKFERGVQFSIGRYLRDLIFADDTVVAKEDETKATDILYDIIQIA